MKKEIWRIIPCFLDYEVSNLGRVRRRVKCSVRGPGYILKGDLLKGGYIRYVLTNDDGKARLMGQRLVITAFRGPIPDGLHVNHLNAIRDDNRLENLEVVTASENSLHSFKFGRVTAFDKGEKHYGAIHTDADIREMRAQYAAGKIVNHIAKDFGCSWTNAKEIVTRVKWRHVI